MADPKPISVAEAREMVDAHAGIPPDTGVHMSNESAGRLWQRILATLDAQRWVPVTERVPDGDAWVLAYYDGMMATMLYTPSCGFYGRTENNMELFAGRITHWMPLPTAPEVE